MRGRIGHGLVALACLGTACAGGLSACGSFGTDDPAAQEDGSVTDGAVGTSDGASTGDAGPTDGGAGNCAIGAPFGPATAIGGLGNYSVEAVRFGQNRALVYLSLCPADGGKPGCEMYQGAVTSADTYGALNPMALVNAANAYDSYPTVTADAQWLFFGSGRGGGIHLYQASAVGGVFQGATPMALPFGASNEPYLLADGHTLYFGASVSTSSVQWDLYRTEGTVPNFGGATLVPGVNGSTDELAPVPSEDELEIFFASTRAPGSGSNLDMWRAQRDKKSDAFGTPERLADLSGAQNEFPTSLSPDRCELYYIRKTGSGAGVGTAYVARRKKP